MRYAQARSQRRIERHAFGCETLRPGSRPLRPGRTRRGGFTLVELLVVIAILMLLLAILTPSLGRARDLTRAMICRSNLHQMGTAMQLYKSTYHFYPCGHSWAPIQPSNVITWAPNLRIYASGQEELFACPCAPEIARWEVDFGSGLPARWGYAHDEMPLYWNTPFSYGHNNWGTWDFANPQLGLGSMADWVPEMIPEGNANRFMDWGPLREHRVVAPFDMFAIADSRVDAIWDAFIDSNQPPEYPYDRHLDQTNMLFVDGHVKPMYVIDTIDTTFDVQRRWNNDHKPH